MGKGTDAWARTWKAGNRGEKGGTRLIHFVSPAELPLRAEREETGKADKQTGSRDAWEMSLVCRPPALSATITVPSSPRSYDSPSERLCRARHHEYSSFCSHNNPPRLVFHLHFIETAREAGGGQNQDSELGLLNTIFPSYLPLLQ